MNQFNRKGSNFPRWLLPVLIGIFLILAAGSAILAYQIFFAEPDASMVFPKYSQPKDMATAQLDQALQEALKRHPEVLSYLMYRVGITQVSYTEDKNTALLWLALYDKDTDTLIPAEPGLAIAQKTKENNWTVTVQADDGFNNLLKDIPESMIDAETKAQYMSAPQALTKAAPLRGYRLPWKKGVTKFLTGSIGHVLTYKSCPSSCMYAFDFADGGNFPILAAKGGRVKYAVWKFPDNNHENANYIILEDDSTSPVTYQVYFHLSQNSIPEALRVKGTWVNQGQYIGNVDNTGYSSGPHLHFHVHANSTSYWGNSVDIVFEDVSVNGGRPRTCAEAKAFPTYGSQCMPGDKYTSNNGDSKPPTGVLNAPAANTLVTSQTVTLSGYGSDESGVARIQPMVKYDGQWRAAGDPITDSAFVTDVDLCAAGVPDGPLSVGINIWDNGGNKTITPIGDIPIRKKFTCPVLPPACSPAANQAALYNNANFQGFCKVIDIGDISDINSLVDFGDNNLESIQLGGGVSAILYDGVDFSGRSQSLTSSSENLDTQIVGANRVSSLKLVSVLSAPSEPVLNPVSGPNGGDATSSDSIVLSWQPVPGAVEYRASVTGPDGFNAVQNWQPSVSFSLGTLKPGNYDWTASARNSAGEKSASGKFIIKEGKTETLTPITSPYEVGFYKDAAGWAGTGLWTRNSFKVGTESQTGWIFGTDNEYSKGDSRASGDLTSPLIHIGYKGQQFSFRYVSVTESSGEIWDQRILQISVDGGPFQDLQKISGSSDRTSLLESKPIDLSAYVGKNVRFRFHFDTIDSMYNTGLGWAITAVRISDNPSKVCQEFANDDSPENAQSIAVGKNASGQICPAGDVDYFTFTSDNKQAFNATLNITSTATNWQPALSLISSDGKTTLADAKVSGSTAQLTANLPGAGQYLLKVSASANTKVVVPYLDYQLSLIQDTTAPSIKLITPADGSISLALPIALSAEAADGDKPASRVEFYVQPAGVPVEKADRVAVDDSAKDGWIGTIPADYTGKLQGAAVFARAFDQAGNHTDSAAVILAGDGTTPVTHLDALPNEYGSTLINLKWTAVSKVKIDHFELQYQVNNGGWQAWAEPLPGNARETSFFATNGATYSFRIRAITESGAEEFPEEPQVKTTVEKECIPDKYEPKDNVPTNSPSLTSGNCQLHNLCGFKDEDWTSMLLQGGKTYTFKAVPQELAAGVTLQVFNLAGQAVTDEISPETLNSITTLNYQPETSATYYLHVKAANDNLAGTRSIYNICYDQAEPFSPIPVVCGAILIPLLTALLKLASRIRNSATGS
ncbi:peptidoglycan DD-metalloendopeptidase family protein [Leptolinea tardivitalis]|uniref:Fibronectin type-III domain-containing protein n=1 Tax=Leptolinea tardivitalis TaxID=229920 RepID=A0A0P6XBY6_9CHLR|nr:peptidoglycan DD-metalloendopeptidase family protein [Leptolinea tardivitalis]KPL72765.1 hypothetical protein ADM99_06730 [Leptolinea tardivitalis]GAP20884.1 membrane protein related to metalloendopeptidases [Leptolinea tardivitalis]